MEPAELRKQRGLAKGTFTRTVKSLRIAVGEEDQEKIAELSLKTKEAFRALVSANELCVKEEDYEGYLDEVQDIYLDALEAIRGKRNS